MIIQQDENSATFQIKRYEPGKIWINEECYEESVIIRPHQLMVWKPKKLSEVSLSDFAPLLESPPQILILGTGSQLIIPKQDLLAALFEKGIGVEFMDSRKACFTFTVLAAEQRDVAACILLD